jgi:O-antigen/teichoic acid export membrane protein
MDSPAVTPSDATPSPLVTAPASPPPPQQTRKELDHSFAHSVAWSGLAKGISQLLSWLSTFIVARLLLPVDYGLVGMATVFLGVVQLMSEFGLGVTIVTLRNLDRDQVSQLNTVAVLLGVAGLVLCVLAAYPLGWFFKNPAVPLVVLVLATTFPIAGFRVVPNALLQKDLRFKRLAALEAASAFVLAGSMVLFAWFGLRYWTLVIGSVMSAIITTGLAIMSRPHPLKWPRWGSLRNALSFTRFQLGGNLAWYFYSNADFVVAGRLLGEAALGFYSFAWNIAISIPDKITTLITRVTPAYFAAMQDQPEELKRYLLRLTELLSVVTFPALIGLSLVADDFIRVGLGPKWEGSIGPLRLLALYASVNATTPLLSRVLTVRGELRYLFWLGVVLTVLLPISFAIGSQWGPTGVAAAWVAVFPFTRIPVFRRVSKSIGVTGREYLQTFWPATSGVLAMTAAVFLVRALVPSDVPLVARLVSEILAGAAAYLGVLFGWHRQRIQVLIQLRNMWTRRPVAKAAEGSATA